MGGGQIVREIRKHCLMWRRSNAPGKIIPAMLKLPSQHNSFVMLGVIPYIKVAMFSGQKVVRNTARNMVHIVLGICMSTKFASFVLLPNKTEVDLAEG